MTIALPFLSFLLAGGGGGGGREGGSLLQAFKNQERGIGRWNFLAA